MLPSFPLGEQTLAREILESDRKKCRKIGPCGVGERALYVGSRFFSRWYYIPWQEVRRIFKRVAMSQGGFTGRGIFGSMAYLVVQSADGREKACLFKHEEELDALLNQAKKEHPNLPIHSAQAEKRLAERAALEQAKPVVKLTPDGQKTLAHLQKARDFLDARPSLSRDLSAAAKQKRIVDNLPVPALALGTAVGILGLLAACYGLYGLLSGNGSGLYFLLGGGVLFFFVFSANLFPSKWNSKKTAALQWEAAVENCRNAVSGQDEFPVPPQYAHSLVLERMIRVVREGRAESEEKALEIVKEDLRALNSGVTVSQEEHDEVVEIKPMFLVCDYKNGRPEAEECRTGG